MTLYVRISLSTYNVTLKVRISPLRINLCRIMTNKVKIDLMGQN